MDIPKLLRMWMTRPREPQAFLVWARMQPRPALEVEVDRRWKGDGISRKRQAIWNKVAAEWYRSASQSEQVAARERAKASHADELLEWEQRTSTVPAGPDEAVQYAVFQYIEMHCGLT